MAIKYIETKKPKKKKPNQIRSKNENNFPVFDFELKHFLFLILTNKLHNFFFLFLNLNFNQFTKVANIYSSLSKLKPKTRFFLYHMFFINTIPFSKSINLLFLNNFF